MSVDFYPCIVCGNTFCECGDHTVCVGCREYIGPCCMSEMARKYGTLHEESEEEGDAEAFDDFYGNFGICAAPRECDNCTSKIVHEKDVLEWVLAKIEMSYDEAKETIEKERGIK